MIARYIISLLVIVTFSIQSYATPILNDASLWTDGAANWSVVNTSYSSPQGNAQETGSGTTAGILFSGGGTLPAATLSASAGNFIGNLQNNDLIVSFRFTSVETPPNQTFGSLAIYFKSSNDTTWYYDLTPPSAIGSMNYSVFLGSQGAWYRSSGSGATNYWADVGLVTEFGFEVIGANYLADQNYQISDVYFSVPEPESVLLIFVVMASLMITFRARISELAVQLKSRFTA